MDPLSVAANALQFIEFSGTILERSSIFAKKSLKANDDFSIEISSLAALRREIGNGGRHYLLPDCEKMERHTMELVVECVDRLERKTQDIDKLLQNETSLLKSWMFSRRRHSWNRLKDRIFMIDLKSQSWSSTNINITCTGSGELDILEARLDTGWDENWISRSACERLQCSPRPCEFHNTPSSHDLSRSNLAQKIVDMSSLSNTGVKGGTLDMQGFSTSSSKLTRSEKRVFRDMIDALLGLCTQSTPPLGTRSPDLLLSSVNFRWGFKPKLSSKSSTVLKIHRSNACSKDLPFWILTLATVKETDRWSNGISFWLCLQYAHCQPQGHKADDYYDILWRNCGLHGSIYMGLVGSFAFFPFQGLPEIPLNGPITLGKLFLDGSASGYWTPQLGNIKQHSIKWETDMYLSIKLDLQVRHHKLRLSSMEREKIFKGVMNNCIKALYLAIEFFAVIKLALVLDVLLWSLSSSSLGTNLKVLPGSAFMDWVARLGASMVRFLEFLGRKRPGKRPGKRPAQWRHPVHNKILLGLLLYASPVTATHTDIIAEPPRGTKYCSSLLAGLYYELAQILTLWASPYPTTPRIIAPHTLLLGTLLSTTFTVLLYTFLRTQAHTTHIFIIGLLASSLIGTIFATDMPEFIFRYLFIGANIALMGSGLYHHFEEKYWDMDSATEDFEAGVDEQRKLKLKEKSEVRGWRK